MLLRKEKAMHKQIENMHRRVERFQASQIFRPPEKYFAKCFAAKFQILIRKCTARKSHGGVGLTHTHTHTEKSNDHNNRKCARGIVCSFGSMVAEK